MLVKNLIPEKKKAFRFKSAKTISSYMNYSSKTKETFYKNKSHSYDNINKKLEQKANISNSFPISESFSIISNSREDINKNYKKLRTFDDKGGEPNPPEIKKIVSSNVVNSSNKLREEFISENKSNLKINIKRPNFLIKSCFYKKNSDIYQSKISRALSKKETSPVFNFFSEIDVEPNMSLLKKNYKVSFFRKPKVKKEKKSINENNILNDELLNVNEDLIKIIKADSSDDENEVKSFYGDHFDFANEIDKINKIKDKEDMFNDSINNIKNNNSINCSSPNFSEGLNNSLCLNKSLNDELMFKNPVKIFRTNNNNNNLSLSLNNSSHKAQEEKINSIIYENNNNNIYQEKKLENNNINNLNYINNIINENNQNLEEEKYLENQNILHRNMINNNNNPINNINQPQYQNNIDLNEENNNNYLYKSNNILNPNSFQYPYINNTINYIFQNNTNLFYNNNPFYMNNNNINQNAPYNYFPYQFNNINNQNYQNQYNPIINTNIFNNYNNYYNQNNNIYNYNNNNSNINNNNNNKRQSYIKKDKKINIENYENLSELNNIELAKISHILAKKKDGSKYLENIIESNPSLASSLFFPYSLAYFEEISNNKYGNFYIKKIIKYLDKELLSKLIEFLSPLIIRLGTNQFGSKIIEQLIKSIKDDDNLILNFIQKIIPNITLLINDINGTHIIYKLILLKSKNKILVEEQILKNIKSIYVSREGSNLLKKFFDIINKDCNNTKDYKKMLIFINIINNNLQLIITDQFGNYLIRHIIQNLNIFINEILYKNIITNLIYFSNQKYSSNVVENCLDNKNWGKLIIEKICDHNTFNCIFLNEYGNYVIQKVLSLADENQKNILFNYIIQASKQLQSLPFGQKLISKLLLNYPKLSMYLIGMNL